MFVNRNRISEPRMEGCRSRLSAPACKLDQRQCCKTQGVLEHLSGEITTTRIIQRKLNVVNTHFSL
jgi:hypothetical protein